MANESLRQEITERRKLEKALLEIEDRERQHIGYELHDSLGQLLTGISFKTRCLQNELTGRLLPEAEAVADIGALISEAKIQAKMLAQGLSPIGTEGGGLMSALESLSKNTQRLFNLRCVFVCDEPVQLKNEKAILQLYRIAQEALSNARKHANASRVVIQLAFSSEKTRLAIIDDGQGFDLPKEISGFVPMGKLGLLGMYERVRLINAKLEIKTGKGDGTTIAVEVDE
jgi:signal transduction histidine kinase